MKISELKFITNSTLVELLLSLVLLVFSILLNHMLLVIFPKASEIISLIITGSLMLFFYSFARNSIAKAANNSRLIEEILKLIK